MKLGDAKIQIIDGDRGKNYPNIFTSNGYCLFLSAKNVTSTGFSFSDTQFVTQERDNLLRKGKLKRGDVVLTTRGTVGNVAYYDDSVPYDNVRINSGMVILRADPMYVSPLFLYYALKDENAQSQIANARTGSAQPQYPISHMVHLDIDFPSIADQIEIGYTLRSLDDKIANNRAINNHLEQMAQAIFKSWFVGFEPSKPFTEVVQVLGGGTPKTGAPEFWNGEIPFFTPKDALGTYVLTTEKTLTETGLSNCNSRLYPVNTVFVTARGTVGKLALAGSPMAMNQSCYALVGTAGYGQHYVYHLAQYVVESLKYKASGAVFDAIVTRDFESEIVPSVTVDEASLFEERVAPIYETILNNSNENAQLATLRDSLLPRLMSGELSVADLDDAK
jgi:type I restriction enzyme S subunit